MTDATTITPQRNTLSKSERVASRNTVETLFGGGHSRALSAFPLRMVYMLAPRAEGEPAAQMLVSVPKRWFKRAVKRNRIKRQVREAYRTSKHQLLADIDTLFPGQKLVMAFIYIDGELLPSAEIDAKLKNLLCRVGEKLNVKCQRRHGTHKADTPQHTPGRADATDTTTALQPGQPTADIKQRRQQRLRYAPSRD